MGDERILYQIKSLDNSIFRLLMQDVSFDVLLTPTQIQMMYYLIENCGVAYQRDFEKVFHLSRATVSGVLQTMEKNHLIQRVIDQGDARSKKVILNDMAKKLFMQKKVYLEKLESLIVHDISSDDLEIFCSVVMKMKENLKNIDIHS